MFIKFGPQVDMLERISGVAPLQILLRLSTSGHKTHKSSCVSDFYLMIAFEYLPKTTWKWCYQHL